MSVRSVSEWYSYLRKVSRKADGTWVFRGQTDAAWPLQPSIGRSSVWGSNPYSLARERELFFDFCREARRFEARPDTDLEWMALAQHHGLPTRLLDWSTNPLVAAWFAVCDDSAICNARVFMLRVSSSSVLDTVDPFLPPILSPVLARVPPTITRITAQEGLFSVHFDPTIRWMPTGVQVFDIPAGAKSYFRQALDVFGYNRAKLMGDLDALCSMLAWRHRAP